MRHTRHYTLEQAMAVRGWVSQRVTWVRDSRAVLAALGGRVRSAVGNLDPQAGGSYPGREVARPLVELSRAIAELEAVEVILRDVENGLIDFPAIRDGQEVYLCWLVDEAEITHWHPLDAGFGGRQPL
jgi:hypothetical protein